MHFFPLRHRSTYGVNREKKHILFPRGVKTFVGINHGAWAHGSSREVEAQDRTGPRLRSQVPPSIIMATRNITALTSVQQGDKAMGNHRQMVGAAQSHEREKQRESD